ncbi:MAG: hypothetical protein Q9212_004391 [Teloschistes hypoglaucus]
MKLPVTLFPFFVPSALSEALPPCSRNSQTPCSCPSGTDYHQYSVSGVIGAAAADVKAVTSDFFDISWQGSEVLETSGSNNEVGSTRTLQYMTEYGVYNSTEQLTSFTENPDGGYVQTYEQLSLALPIEYPSEGGFFAGVWVTFNVSSCFEHETAVVVTFYTCETGDPFDTGAFFEKAWANAIDILENRGKLSGQNESPSVIGENGELFAPLGCLILESMKDLGMEEIRHEDQSFPYLRYRNLGGAVGSAPATVPPNAFPITPVPRPIHHTLPAASIS